VAGLAVQPFRELSWTDSVGTVAYGAAAVGVVALLLPRRGALLPGVVGTGLACAVEIVQLTGMPAALAERFPPIALVLGSSFDVVDLALLLVGGALATALLSVPPRTVEA
jgi:hypothetical protein